MLTKNHKIIFLYSSVFLVIGLLTAYLPLWLNQSLKLETHHIGYILSLSGILKVLFTLTITIFIKNAYFLRTYLLFNTVFTMTLFLVIYIFKEILPFNIIFFMVILFLIAFSPVLPFVEAFYSSVVKQPMKRYGKIRISGSIAFCLAVFFFGYFISKFSVTIFPLILVISLLLIALSVSVIPTKVRLKKYNSLIGYKALLKNKDLMIFLLVCSILQATHAMYYGYSTIMWEDKGISFFKIGILWSFAIVSEVSLFLKIDKYFRENLLFKTLLFCSIITFLRWLLTYMIENYYILLVVQTLHGVTFALTHYTMIFFINNKFEESTKLFVQSLYYMLTGGIFITIFTISCGHIISYTNGDEGYLLMALFAFLSFIILHNKRKLFK